MDGFCVKREVEGRISYLAPDLETFVKRSQAGRFDYKEARDLARQFRPVDNAAYSVDEAPEVHPADWLVGLAQFLDYIQDVGDYQQALPGQRLEEWKFVKDSQTLWRIMILIKDDVLYWSGIGV